MTLLANTNSPVVGSSCNCGYATALANVHLRPSIVLFGDSITEFGFGHAQDSPGMGWASLLASSYTRRCDVLNRGFQGYNTRMALDVLPRVFGEIQQRQSDREDTAIDSTSSLLAQPRPHELLFCTVLFGSNDGLEPDDPRHVPIDEYTSNLKHIVQEIRQRSCKDLPVLLLTPPPVDDAAWSGLSNERMRRYGEQVKHVALDADPPCSYVDAWRLMHGDNVDRLKEYVCHDGVHLNQAGNRMLYRGLVNVLQTNFPHLTPMGDEDDDDDRDGLLHGTVPGIPKEEKPWKELC